MEDSQILDKLSIIKITGQFVKRFFLFLLSFFIAFNIYSFCFGTLMFDNSDFLMKIDWYGPETKPVNRAAFATSNRKMELNKWQEKNRFFRHIAIISKNEVASLERLFSKEIFLKMQTPVVPKHNKQLYVIAIESKGNRYYFELGFSKKILDILELIKKCLETTSRQSIIPIIEQVKLWGS